MRQISFAGSQPLYPNITDVFVNGVRGQAVICSGKDLGASLVSRTARQWPPLESFVLSDVEAEVVY